MTKFEIAGLILFAGGNLLGFCLGRARDRKPVPRSVDPLSFRTRDGQPFREATATLVRRIDQEYADLLRFDDVSFDWPEQAA